ncbi:MAG TPA: Rrf2 family transcriptional regulator [Baekduia sp.]|nr:Rrf2 family transcriptional regulator [Baekduia sp.]
MIFTTKAEYGVRLLVELGRQHDGSGTGVGGPIPVSLKAIAEAEALPLAYLERIVALLKKAGLVEATRGAHGGYRLTRQPGEIHMDEVVLALEGGVAPMTCFVAEDSHAPHGRVVCNHEADSGHGCATKLLWTRVQGGVVKALAQTTLAELVAFSNRTIPTPTSTSIASDSPAVVA